MSPFYFHVSESRQGLLMDFCVTGDVKIPIVRHVLAGCEVKNRLKGDFLRVYGRSAANCWKVRFCGGKGP
jgi:hypothetical protein